MHIDKPRLLLAEDNLINQEVIRGFLNLRSWDCDTVLNGEQAIKAMQNQAYDLVLMDVQMPVLNGLEATRRIRQLPDPLCHTPIMALTANAMHEERTQYLDAGMDGYASKPIQREEFFAEMERLLQRRRRAEPAPKTSSVA